ncbi:MAG: hypothetical protein CM1200mP2_49740 [Planctomycetaceae bacterium]|nr:MAG: hypothetical protein CM1200mP2_49740 [Planctomycetaceae bacterium]
MPGIVVDGQDVFAVYEAAGEAFRRARDGEGPTLLECQTYRYFGHFEGDEIKYRTRDEEAHYRERDCLEHFRSVVLDGELLEAEELDAIDREAEAAIVDAVAFAESNPLPHPTECLEGVYVPTRHTHDTQPGKLNVAERELTYRGAINEALRQEMRRTNRCSSWAKGIAGAPRALTTPRWWMPGVAC